MQGRRSSRSHGCNHRGQAEQLQGAGTVQEAKKWEAGRGKRDAGRKRETGGERRKASVNVGAIAVSLWACHAPGHRRGRSRRRSRMRLVPAMGPASGDECGAVRCVAAGYASMVAWLTAGLAVQRGRAVRWQRHVRGSGLRQLTATCAAGRDGAAAAAATRVELS